MKRYIVYFTNTTLGQWGWAENKSAARKQMTPYAHCIGEKITKVEEV